MMELTSHGMQDKNRADIAMVVDALELAFTRDYIDTFVVVSGDSDFTPLVLKMRELNKRVIGIGTRKSTSRLLIQACDEFLFYDTVVQPKRRPSARKPAGQPDEVAVAFTLLEEAIDGLQRENPDPPLASVVKSAVLRKSPDFNEIGPRLPARSPACSRRRRMPASCGSSATRSPAATASTPVGESERPADARRPQADEAAQRHWKDEYLPAGTEAWLEVLEPRTSTRWPRRPGWRCSRPSKRWSSSGQEAPEDHRPVRA